jgi:hypothetical protein
VVLRRALAQRRLARHPVLAVDSTGLDARHASTHYRYRYSPRYRAAYAALHGGRAPAAPHWRPRHPKLTVAADVATHLVLAAVPGAGPLNDAPFFAPVLRQAHAVLAALGRTPQSVVADAGYDAEAAHVLCRDTLGIRSTAIALNRRTCGAAGPRGRYRRRMHRRFPCGLYRQRRQVESLFSRLKRNLGAALTARRPRTQREEMMLRVLTHNLLLLYAHTTFQQSRCHPERAQRGDAVILTS